METSANDRNHAPAPPPEVLSTEKVAELLGLSQPTVRRLVKEGHLPARRPPGGRKLLFLRSDVLVALDRWAAADTDCHAERDEAREDVELTTSSSGPAQLDEATRVLVIDDEGEEQWMVVPVLPAVPTDCPEL